MVNQVIPQNEKSADAGLRRLDSVHLNKLTSLAFSKKDNSENIDKKPNENTEEIEEKNSPLGKFKQMNLEAIDETDSFCTDSSYVPSPDMIKSSPLRGAQKSGLMSSKL